MIVLRRLAEAVPSLVGVVIVTFLLSHALPGDPAAYFAGPAANAESVAEVRRTLGLDRSLPVQFGYYLLDLAKGDLGHSLTTGQPVTSDLLQRLPASMELTLAALIVAIAVALPLGIVAALRPNSLADHFCRLTVTIGAAFPTFFVGLLLVYLLYFKLGLVPQPLGRLDEIYFTPPPTVTGFYLIDTLLNGDVDAFRAALSQLILPAVSLALFAMAPLARMTRAAMLTALGSDFVRTARANGLPARKVIFTYALRSAMLSIVNVMGMVFSFLLGSNVLIEQVFGWPGIGAYAVSAVIASDYAAVQGFVLMMAILYVLLNLAVDLAATAIDPRVRFES
ncbi:peptide/nickel transport system permease protein [Arboricoccus pini]|uniref:Peptide/nickel transport system permease protein n=1 Tax=Arboricoccus pini TaxID=1963835 RepID=A0A212RRX4_9PROT|nr:ABC transporter permease [Arboricoccus pini]SNB75391.1 peptide/nickel transport system permease protein [Arboricoccus pini]